MMGGPLRTFVAISDLHLGAPGSYFALPGLQARVWSKLSKALESVSADVLVLLGDVIDLAVSRGTDAFTSGKDFFNRLLTLTPQFERILYVIGNHDYHLWTTIRENLQFRRLGSPNVGGSVEVRQNAPPPPRWCYAGDAPFSELFPQGLHDRLVITYPFHSYEEETGDGKVTTWFFHHGHYFHFWLMPLKREQAYNGHLQEFDDANACLTEFLFNFLSWNSNELEKGLSYRDAVDRANRVLRKCLGRKATGGGMAPVDEMRRILSKTIHWRSTPGKQIHIYGHFHTAQEEPESAEKDANHEYHELGGWILETEGQWSSPAFFFRGQQEEKRGLVRVPIFELLSGE